MALGNLYVIPVCPAVTPEGPLMKEEGFGPIAYTVKDRVALLPQELFADTVILPDVNDAGALMTADLPLFCTTENPGDTVHV